MRWEVGRLPACLPACRDGWVSKWRCVCSVNLSASLQGLSWGDAGGNERSHCRNINNEKKCLRRICSSPNLNGRVSLFRFMNRSKERNSWVVLSDVISTTGTKTIEHLTPSREYQVSVTAFSDAGSTQADFIVQTTDSSTAGQGEYRVLVEQFS